MPRWLDSLILRQLALEKAAGAPVTDSTLDRIKSSAKSPVVLTSFGALSVGVDMAASAITRTSSTTVFGTANRAILVPFRVDESTILTKVAWLNGLTVAGNLDVGIYDTAFARQGSLGSTAQAGASSIQRADLVDITLSAGRWYMAIAGDNVSSTFMASTFNDGSHAMLTGIIYAEASFPLPANVTITQSSLTNIPMFGFTLVPAIW